MRVVKSLQLLFAWTVAIVAFFAASAVFANHLSYPPGPAVKVAVNPATNKVYLVNEASNSVTVVDRTAGTTATIPVGARPYFIAVNPATNRIYVVNANDSSLSVIDGTTDTNLTPGSGLATGSVGPIAINPLTNTIYIVRFTGVGTDEVTYFNGSNNTWYTIATESFQPIAVASNPVTDTLYVAHYGTGDVRIISGANNGNAHPVTQSLGMWSHPFAIAANPVTNKVYVLTEDVRGPIGIIDGATRTATFPAVTSGHAVGPKSIAINPATNKVYALFQGEVVVIDGASGALTYLPVSTGTGAASIAVNVPRNQVYVAGNNGVLTTINGDDNLVTTATVPTGADGLGVNPVRNEVFVFGPDLTVVPGGGSPHTVPLPTTVTPLPSNQGTASDSITVNASSAFTPNAMPVGRVHYRFDSPNGAFSTATGSGTFSIPLTGLADGSHTLYVYAADGQDAPLHTGSAAPVVGNLISYVFTIGTTTKATPTVSLGSTPNPSTYGQNVTFTISVTGSAGTPTGTITLKNNGGSLTGCRLVALSSGSTTCSVILPVGTNPMTADYSGDSNYQAATSSAINQVVNKATPSLSLASSANPSTAGQSVTFTATIGGPSTVNGPGGTMDFLDGATVISGCAAKAVNGNTSNVATTVTCTTSALAAGSHSVTARYNGDSVYNVATSAAVAQTVNGAALLTPTVGVSSSANPSNAGNAVTFIATVSGSGGTPTGTVTFRDGGTTLSGCAAVALGSGQATCGTSSLAVGDHSITVQYSGDGTYNGGASNTLTQTVNPAMGNVTIAVGSSANPSTAGQNVTFTATVSGGSAGTPTGSMSFASDGSTIGGCASVALSSGAATCTTNALTAGTHTITASYSGSSSYNPGTSAGLTQTVQASGGGGAATNVALASAGTVATASSESPGFPVASIIDGDRRGLNWGNNSGWNDATRDAFPDWVQLDFAGARSIDRVVVYTLQDNYTSPVEPSDTLTFANYGVVDFTVEGWNGSAWVTLGTVTGNNLVKRTVAFTATTVSRVRVTVTNALVRYSRIVEVEAWTPGTAAPPPAGGSNVALASAGAVATASSTNASFSTAALINGDRAGTTWWNDDTRDTWPDWVQVAFSGTQTIDRVVVYTLQDNYASPVDPSDTMTFSLYGVQDFTVEGWNGSAWVTLGSVANNNLVKRTVTFAPFTTDRIRVSVTRGLVRYSRITEVEAWSTGGGGGTPAAGNYAAASAGSTATASTESAGFAVSSVIDGERRGLNWGSNGGWNDATRGTWPDWVEVNFNATRNIDRVVVYTLQDNYSSPSEPTDTMTFANYGIVDFTVEGWNGTAWVALGSVTGNNLVKRTVTFPATNVSRIRVTVSNSLVYYSRITEIEAFGP